MHTRTVRSADRPTSPSEAPLLDLMVARAVSRHPWLRALGIGVVGLFSLLLLYILTRLFVISQLQGHLLDPLGRVVTRLDLSANARKLVWFATFAWSAASLPLVIRCLLHLAFPLRALRSTWRETLLLVGLFGGALLAPDVAKKVFPVKQVAPETVAWFSESEDGGIEPHGLIGYVHQEDGSWWFCNVRGGPRPADGATIQPVTRQIHQEWSAWLKQQREETAREEAARARELQRQRETEAQQRAVLDHAATERNAAEAAAKRAEQERLATEVRLEQEKRKAAQAATELEQRKKEAAEAEARASAERIRMAEMRTSLTPARNDGTSGPSVAQPSSPKAEPDLERPFHQILLSEPVPTVQPAQVPDAWRPCRNCGHLPTAHYWMEGRMTCPTRRCLNCGQLPFAHRHLRERRGRVILDRVACP